MALITASQFETRLGRTLSASETGLVDALIDDASALAVDIVDDATVTDSWDAATPGTVPASVVPVVTSMVRRGLERPHDNTGMSLGDYSYTGASGVGVFATRREAKLLRKAAGKSPVAALDLEGDLPGYVSRAQAWLDGAL